MNLGNELRDIPFKGRGLMNFVEYVGDFKYNEFQHKKQLFRVLEIGCGFGQLLIELSSKLPGSFEFHGINNYCDILNHKKALYVASLRGVELPRGFEVSRINFTNFDIENGIPFPDNFFDLVISQVCIPYIKNKLFLIEEVNRVLLKSGKAFLHVGFEQSRLCDKTPYNWETLVLLNDVGAVDPTSFFYNYENIQYEMKDSGSVIKMMKSNKLLFSTVLLECNELGSLNSGFYGVQSKYYILT